MSGANWGAYIWNEVSVIFRGLQYTVEKSLYFLVIDTHFWVHIEMQLIRWVLKFSLSLGRRKRALSPGGLLCILIGQ